MARKKAHTPLHIYLNGRLVGRLNRQTSGAVDFSYDSDWLAWQYAMPVSRSLPLRENRYIGDPVLAVFDNLLPDNDMIRRRLAESVGAPGIDAYNLLSKVGRDCVGALQFLPEGETPGDIDEIVSKPLSKKGVATIIRGLERSPLGLDADEDFRISLAGAQEKTALLYHQGKWRKPVGTTPTTHILKPAIGQLPNGLDMTHSVENEFLCMTLAHELGLKTANVKIQDFEDQHVLVIERFDRRWTKDGRLLRLPQEDFCQALSIPPTLKYESERGPGMLDILNLLKESDTPAEDQHFFLKAQIVFWMMGATDGHAKNFSMFLSPGGRFHMTPLYDILSVAPCYAAHQIRRNQLKLAMAVGDKRYYRLDQIAPRHFIQTAKKAGISAQIIEDIFDDLYKEIPKAIRRTEKRLPKDFPAEISGPIFESVEARQPKA
jgi:serine/threonine-protein kinase HipA